MPIIGTSTNITLDLNNYTVISNTSANAVTVTLPSNSIFIAGRIYIIKKTSASFSCTIDTIDSALIDGANSQTVTNFMKVQSDGTNWWVIG